MTKLEDSKVAQTMSAPPEVNFNIVLQLIPDFDTTHDSQVYRFIRSCDSAFRLANSSQQEILLVYALNKISGTGSSDTHAKQYANWGELRSFLIQKYSRSKTLAHLNLELQSMFQKPTESVNEYLLKVDLCRSKIVEKLIAEIPDNTITGRMATAEETALNVFVNGLKSDIGIMLRTKEFSKLSDAGRFAVQEDQIRNMNIARQNLYRSEATKPPPLNYKHTFQSPVVQRPPSNSTKICNYCKNPGHVISECRKRAYNNGIKNLTIPQTSFTRNHQTPSRPTQVNNLNSFATGEMSSSSEIVSNPCSTL